MSDLYIRWSNASPKDVGVRPLNPCWPPNAFWTNASIWMSYPGNHPVPAKRNMTATAVELGEEVFINVAVFSKGADFDFPTIEGGTPIKCQVWACTGANGVGPVSALASSGGAAGITGLVIGNVSAPDYFAVARVLWTPLAADALTFDANGAAHVCLAANLVYDVPQGSIPAAQGQYLPPFAVGGSQVTTIFPCGDGPTDPRSLVPIGHFQGQKNVQVLTGSGGTPLRSEIRMWSRGGRSDARHTLELVERRGRSALDRNIREHLLAHPAVGVVGGKPRRQRFIKVTPRLFELLEPSLGAGVLESGLLPREPAERSMLAGGGRLVLSDREAIGLKLASTPLAGAMLEDVRREGDRLVVEIGPAEPTRVVVNLEAARDDTPGTVRIFDLTERVEGNGLVGGTTFITVAPTG